MDVTTQMLENRYGKASGLENYLLKADAQGYEAMRAMFEAFRVRLPKTTGIIQWMLNSAWPSTYWQLYDYYLLPTSAYYATRKANEPLQLMYDYHNNTVFTVNETRNDAANLKASIRLFDLSSKLLSQREVTFALSANTSEKLLELDSLTCASLLDIRLFDTQGQQITQNFYWLSDKKDEFAWDKTTWAYTPQIGFADFTGLNSLPSTEISASYLIVDGTDNLELLTTLENPSHKIAFFINLAVLDGSGNQVFPVFWNENYISLMPGEKRNLTCSIPKSILKGSGQSLQITGWNIGKRLLEIK